MLFRLFDLTFNQGEDLLARAQEFSRKELRLTGARGKILDRNGLPLAYNETSYDVQFVKDPKLRTKTDRERYTKSIIRTIDIIEENGGKLSTRFAMERGEDGVLTLSWPGLDPVEDKGSYDRQVNLFRGNMSSGTGGKVKKTMELEEMLANLREFYFIPASFTEEKAMKVLGVWQEAVYSAYQISYIPAVLAKDVDMNTVAQVEIRANELIGMQIGQGRTRVYPNKSMAAHIIGYTGRMLNEKTIVQNEQAGYKRDDLVGITGIEASQELELTGNIAERTGTRVVEADSQGKVIRELESDNKQPTAGNNVMLTIDSGLQKVLEEALPENIKQIRAVQEDRFNDPKAKEEQDYDEKIRKRSEDIGKEWPLSYCNSGAAVVMDVHTGDILAMGSYPTYDLNLFTGGISKDALAKLMEDPANPLFNRAIASRGTPGSIFKMATGLAGLMEGVITTETQISDEGPYTKHTTIRSQAPKCYTTNYAGHANLNIVDALKVSCNYFFFTVADGLKSDKLNKWADLLGLTSLTGVELPGEVKSQVGNQKTLYDPDSSPGGVASLVYKNILGIIKEACDAQKLNITDEKYDAVVRELMQLAELTSEMGPDIRAILKNELNLDSQVIISRNMASLISLQLVQIKWDDNDTIVTGIGQSVTMLTPIAVARYMSAIVNGGEVYDAKLVKAIVSPEGKVRDKPPVLVRNLNVPNVTPNYLDKIKEGMEKVVSEEDGGTAGKDFEGFEYLKEIGGKTGTAQVSKIDLENNAWFVAFAPFEKPEIAVVVYMPNGYSGHYASYTARQVIQYYMDQKKMADKPATLPVVNTLTR